MWFDSDSVPTVIYEKGVGKGRTLVPYRTPNLKIVSSLPHPTSELRLHFRLENSEDGTVFIRGHGDLGGTSLVPGGVQDLIRALFCEKNQPKKLGVIEHKLSLKKITVRQARSRSTGK